MRHELGGKPARNNSCKDSEQYQAGAEAINTLP
jgi:hypothetical protein